MGGVWVRVTVGKERQPPATHNEFAQVSNISVEMRPRIINRNGMKHFLTDNCKGHITSLEKKTLRICSTFIAIMRHLWINTQCSQHTHKPMQKSALAVTLPVALSPRLRAVFAI